MIASLIKTAAKPQKRAAARSLGVRPIDKVTTVLLFKPVTIFVVLVSVII